MASRGRSHAASRSERRCRIYQRSAAPQPPKNAGGHRPADFLLISLDKWLLFAYHHFCTILRVCSAAPAFLLAFLLSAHCFCSSSALFSTLSRQTARRTIYLLTTSLESTLAR